MLINDYMLVDDIVLIALKELLRLDRVVEVADRVGFCLDRHALLRFDRLMMPSL